MDTQPMFVKKTDIGRQVAIARSKTDHNETPAKFSLVTLFIWSLRKHKLYKYSTIILPIINQHRRQRINVVEYSISKLKCEDFLITSIGRTNVRTDLMDGDDKFY